MLGELGFDYKLAEASKLKAERLQFSALPQNRIMSLGAIRKVCLKYGLRFLPTRFYKGALDSGIGPKVDEFKALLGSLPTITEPEIMQDTLAAIGAGLPARSQFYIAAPSESFAITLAPKDPLLFCRLSFDKFFLVHKWGADLKEKDVAKHDIHSRNWNSNVQKIADQDYYKLAIAGMLGEFKLNSAGPGWISSSAVATQMYAYGAQMLPQNINLSIGNATHVVQPNW